MNMGNELYKLPDPQVVGSIMMTRIIRLFIVEVGPMHAFVRALGLQPCLAMIEQGSKMIAIRETYQGTSKVRPRRSNISTPLALCLLHLAMIKLLTVLHEQLPVFYAPGCCRSGH